MTSIAFLFVAYLCSTRFVTLANGSSDWVADWEDERTLHKAFEIDPNDNRATMRGSGEIRFGNEVSIFEDSPRLYISNGSHGWEDVEFTAYGNYIKKGSAKSYSGLTLGARSNHDNYKSDGCDAFGYYARIYLNSGECAFQKEYYHGGSTVYSPSKRTGCFAGGLPLNQWIGMKFRVTTVPGTDNVKLELFLDRQNSGDWTLGYSFTDIPGQWKSSKSVPSQCPHDNGDTVLGARNVCFLRSDGSSSTEVHWRDASIRHLPTDSSSSPSTIPSSSSRPSATSSLTPTIFSSHPSTMPSHPTSNPTSRPSNLPSYSSPHPSTTPSLSTAPTGSSFRPSISPSMNCFDAVDRFETDGKSKECKWVSKKRSRRCKDEGAQKNCPITCKVENCSCRNTSASFEYRGDIVTCAYVDEKRKSRCKRNELRSRCPLSCRLCNPQ